MSEGTVISPQAVVSDKALLGERVSIAPFVVIDGDVRIGNDVRIGPFCHISEGTTIEDRCIIESGAKISILPKAFTIEPKTGVLIQQDAHIGENVTVERSSRNGTYTTIGNNSWILPGVHVGHNSSMGQFSFLTNGTKLAGYVNIGDFVVIGGDVGVHQFCAIGRAAFVAGGVKVTKDVPPYSWLASRGDRTRAYGLNAIGMKRSGMRPEQAQNAKAAYEALRDRFTEQERISALTDLNTDEARAIAEFLKRSRRGAYLVESSRLINPAAMYKKIDYHSSNNKH